MTTNAKQLQTIANTILDSLSREQVREVAHNGFTGALPVGLDETETEDLLLMIQGTAMCIAAGGVRHG